MKLTTDQITTQLFDALWEQYIRRVSYAKIYADMVKAKGGRVMNDHIAFRTLNTPTGKQPKGIAAIWHILDALNFKPANSYDFKVKKLHANHFEHPNSSFPKIFISQLEVTQLPDWTQQLINEQVKETPYLISDMTVNLLMQLKKDGFLEYTDAELLVLELAGYFRRPWGPPKQETILKLNEVSQYAAWTLLHGNSVNHFTAYINFQDVAEWPDLEATCQGLEQAGVPMKDQIEGKKGSKLRQSSTKAVEEQVEVISNSGNLIKIPWTYAYYELAERGYIEENGEKKLFSGFLGEQATHLFDMTKTGDQ